MRKSIVYVSPFIIIFLGIFVLIVFTSSSNNLSKENNGYTRVINCVISKNAVSRSQGDIENCYQKVESDLEIKLHRYDR